MTVSGSTASGRRVIVSMLLLIAGLGGGCGRKSDVSLPPLDRRCRVDADCTYDTTSLQPVGVDLRCCNRCSGEAGSTSWAARVTTICSSIGSDDCPMKKCEAFPPVGCVQGLCTVVSAP
jgi:predicted small lipoprotein YifL